MFFKEPCICSVADSLNMRVYSSDSSLQLTVLGVSLLFWVSAFCRFQASRLAVIATLSSASSWASPLHSRPGSLHLHFCCGATISAICSVAVAKTVFTSTLLSLGGTALRWSPITVATSGADGGHSSAVAGR